MKKILAALFLVPALSFAMDTGQDWLALQHKRFDVRSAVKALEPGRVTGNLDTTLGSSLSHVNYLIKFGSIKAHRVHFYNGSCIRNNRCSKRETGHGYSVSSFDTAAKRGRRSLLLPIKRAARRYCEVFRGRGIVLLGSPVLEHQVGILAFRRLTDSMLSGCPDIRPVNNPMSDAKVERYRGALIERHLIYSPMDADIISTDGLSLFDTYWLAFPLPKTVSIFLGWTHSFNCAVPGPFITPADRKLCPYKEEFQYMAEAVECTQIE